MEFPHQRKSRRIFEKGGSLQVLILWYRKSQARSERFDKPWRRKGGTRNSIVGGLRTTNLRQHSGLGKILQTVK